MATDAIFTLNPLRCISERGENGGTEPYVWPALVRIDDETLSTPSLVQVIAHGNRVSREVLATGMRSGDVAEIPPNIGSLSVRLEDDLTTLHLIVVVVLLEKDETPFHAVRAGYNAFRSELRAALGNLETLLGLSEAAQIEDEEERQAAIDELVETVEARIKGRVENATWDALSGFEKARVLAGILNLDDSIGTGFNQFSELEDIQETLSFGTDSSSIYEIDADLRVRAVPVELCSDELERVKAAQAAVKGIEDEIDTIRTELANAPPSQKPGFKALLERLRDIELPAAIARLEAARRSLQACRDRGTVTSPGGVIVETTSPPFIAGPSRPGPSGSPRFFAEVSTDPDVIGVEDRITEIYERLASGGLTFEQQKTLVNEVSELHDFFVRNGRGTS